MLKECSVCKQVKELKEFTTNNRNPDGKASHCKVCKAKMAYEQRGSIEGVVTEMYSSQRACSKKRDMAMPTYTKVELKDWLLAQPSFKILYDGWIKSGRDVKLKPSVDRLDDYLGYTMQNIQLVSWETNNLKGYANRLIGKNNKVSIGVIQCSLLGEEIKEYHSIAEASRQTGADGTHIANVAKGREKTAGGYIWKFISDKE